MTRALAMVAAISVGGLPPAAGQGSVGPPTTEIQGRVTEVRGDTVVIGIEGAQVPAGGDRVDLFFRLPDGEAVSVGTWRVTAGGSGRAEASRVEASGQPQVGYEAVIHSSRGRAGPGGVRDASPGVVANVAQPPPGWAPPASPPAPSTPYPGMANDELRRFAGHGDPGAQRELAVRLYIGRTESSDPTEALGLMVRAVEASRGGGRQPMAQRDLDMLDALVGLRRGPPETERRARALVREAAEAGSADAMAVMAGWYGRGIDGAPDYQESERWRRRAAAAGHVRSMAIVGMLDLTQRRYVEALRLLTRPCQDAEVRDNLACFWLGEMHRNGWGVPPARDEAIRWYRLATRPPVPVADAERRLRDLGASTP